MTQTNYTPEQRKRRYEATQRWRDKNQERIKAYRKAYYQKTRDKYLPLNNKWNHDNKERASAVFKKYVKEHPAERALLNGARRAKTTNKIRLEEIENWHSRICGICKLIIEDKYHLDHKTPLARGGLHVVENLQLTHPSCNMRKGQKLDEEYRITIL